MKVALITHGTYLCPDQIVSGNSVRAYYLAHGLLHHGIEVVHIHPHQLVHSAAKPKPPQGIAIRTYTCREELVEQLHAEAVEALIVGYWELLDLIPDNLDLPIVLDVVAPRVLEAMFQRERDLSAEIRRMLQLYRKADRFLVGTHRQRHFLLPWLIMAGFDCRNEVPIDVVPISTQAGKALPCPTSKTSWRFVSGGVVWPWRQTERYFDPIVASLKQARPKGELVLFSGKYIYAGDTDPPILSPREASWPADIVKRHPLQPYGKLEQFLQQHCDIGLELADHNVEREYSQSFRATEFLRCGLPVICNDYLEHAELIKDYDAGWLVGSVAELPQLLKSIAASPADWHQKSQNALRLIDQQFDYRHTVKSIVRFLNRPQTLMCGQALVGTDRLGPSPAPPPTIRDQLRNILVRTLRNVLKRTPKSSSIAIITRSDIYPADHGAAVKIDRTAWGLSHHVQSVFIVTDNRHHYHIYRQGQRTQQTFPLWIRWLAPPRWRVRHRLIGQMGLPAADAFLYYPLLDWSYICRTVYLASKFGIRIFQAEFPAFARACLWGRRLFGGNALMVEHNIEYQRLHDQLPDMDDSVYSLLRNCEIGLAGQMDAVITVSDRDRRRLLDDGVDYRLVHTIPHGVDIQQFDSCSPVDLRARFNIPRDTAILVYHGIYLYPPNAEAMQAMATEVFPRLRQRGLKAVLLAIGRHPPATSPDPAIIFTGAVATVAPYLCAADAAVVPLLQGGGTRMKVLDYFAARLPVISTTKGIEGIPVEHDHQALIADDFDRFTEYVHEVLTHPQKAQKLGQGGRAFVEKLDWREIAQHYLDIIKIL